MTSRPGPGIQESLQHRGGGPAYAPVRRTANPQHGHQDPTVESERPPAEERATKAKPKGKPIPLDGIQTTTSDGVRLAPKGKPQLFFSNAAGSGAEQLPHSQSIVNLPVPPRPGSSMPGDTSQQRRLLPGGTGVKSEAAIKVQGSDAPVPAAVFPGGKTADLFPWSGNHPEDVLSETLVKGGISNKSQIMNETNTARPSLWSNLKNKSGISTLSTLFVAVLEKRQSCSRLTTPNTFKPPPRLTLRDSTRETWLHDLANPTVGLRRLRRTIPTGITGKVLLEQCLNKNIPIPRAIWLAKCVGINEIRTHKRKGQVGTSTWVRTWTSSVEQFLEGTAATIGQQEWKPRITYALQLATHLFKEHLLEEDHFLDWIIKSLDSSSPERLFLWLLIVCIPDFWLNLTSSRRRGKRVAESLLNYAEKLYEVEEENPNAPVLAFLENIILKLLITKPACFLLPKTWERHQAILQNLAQRRSQAAIIHAIANLDERNKQVIRPSNSQNPGSYNPAGRIYRLLDAVDYSVSIRIDELALDCMEITSNATQLISTVLQWASSLYRQGSHRVYLVTRLLRRWSHLGADVYEGILAYLPRVTSDPSKEPRQISRVIAELVRSKTFPIGRYLQWLIATGSLSHHQNLYSSSAWPLRLLTEIPLSGLSDHVHTLRSTLLRSTVYSVEAEEQAIIAAEDAIRQQMPGLFDTGKPADGQGVTNIASFSPTIRFEIGTWLRHHVAASLEVIDCVPTKDPSVEIPGSVSKISLPDFHIVRAYLEQFEDLSILADIIGIAATSFDSGVLSAAADTLHYNSEAFRAIGAFDPLFEKIAMRYAAIRTVRFPERDLLLSLTDVARTAGADAQLTQLLTYDLSRYDQKNSLAACSPASDNMIDGITAMDSDDEIERILSSGTSMDQQMMSRVFRKIATNLEEQLCKGNHYVENFSSWLYRLRSFEESTFDMILTSWLGSLLMSHQAQLLNAAVPPLVASGCLNISRLCKTVQDCIRSRRSSQPAESLRIAIEGLDKVLPSDDLNGPCAQQDLYRYRLEQYKFCRMRDSGILEFIRDIVELEASVSNPTCRDQVSSLFSSDRLLDVLKHFAVSDTQSLLALMSSGHQTAANANHARIKSLLDSLLDPVNHLRLSQIDYMQQVGTVVERADQLSLPFCQLELQHIFSENLVSSEDAVDGVSAALLAAIKIAIENDQPCWSDLISGLEPGLSNKIREHAEREMISASAFLCVPNTFESSSHMTDKEASIRRYLSVIDATTTGTPPEAHASLLVPLIERFKGIAELLSRGRDFMKGKSDADKPFSNSNLCYWLNALLRLAVVHGPEILPKASNQHQAALLWTLRALTTHTGLEAFPSVSQHVFDTATLLSDHISDDVRKHLARLDIAKAIDDPRCTFIFGSVAVPDGWLSLTKPVTTSQSSLGVSSPQSQPQSLNAGQPQHPSQQQQSSSPAPLQRSSSQQHLQQPLPSPTQARAYPQYPQHPQSHRMLPQQLQRMASNGNNGQPTQLQQLQQMQQMQALAQQRNSQPSPVQQQRTASISSQTGGAAKGMAVKLEKVEMKPVPFALNRWEILPESGGNPAGNETAISLSLFGARKV